jgi:hypothetical protein
MFLHKQGVLIDHSEAQLNPLANCWPSSTNGFGFHMCGG